MTSTAPFAGPVLVVAAHPDDEVLGCGAAMARLRAAGVPVAILILGEGSTSRSPSRGSADQGPVSELVDEAREAARRLDIDDLTMAGLPDNRFDQVALLDIVKEVEVAVERLAPITVLTHSPGDLNIDHSLTARAVLTATRPTPGSTVREVLAFEIASSTEWAFQRVEPAFRPSVFIDASDGIEDKVHALEAYASEMREFPHPRSISAIRAIARRWGSVVGVEAAEAFELIRAVR